MTRKDQIRNKAIDFSEYEDNFLEYDDCGDVCDDKLFIENAFISGAKWADETMIEKACEWLDNNAENYVIQGGSWKWIDLELKENFKNYLTGVYVNL